MKIYSIVQTVAPGTPCSHPPGRREVDHFGNHRLANEIAERYNATCTLAGIKYTVEEVDEFSPDRAPWQPVTKR